MWEDTFPLRGKDGVYRWFLSKAEPMRNEAGRIVRWFGTNTNIDQQKRDEQQRTLLLRELDHRVKNLFAIVGGMITLSARSAATPQELAKAVQGRLGALASSHRLISPRESANREVNHGTTLAELVRSILAPFFDPAKSGADTRVVIDGPQVPIGGDAVTNLALILHELATNAAKYGAFSVASGQVRISWTVKKGRLALVWEERGGPKVAAAPKSEGFGSLLARRSIGGRLEGELAFDWKPKGLIVHLSAPTERLTP